MVMLGQEEMLECMMSAALEVRRGMCAYYGVAEGDGLQGSLIEAHARAVGDPDTVAAKWLSQESTPLGIDAPIELGGVFPRAEPSVASDEVDHWCHE